jgi:hypothetical protein
MDFSTILAPISVGDFVNGYFGKQYLLNDQCTSRYDTLMPWRVFNTILRDLRPESTRIRMVKDSVAIPHNVYTESVPRRGESLLQIRGAEVTRLLRTGATLIVNQIEELHFPLRQLATDIERHIGERVTVNCYVSAGTTKGFDLHWDDHDVLVLQVHGRKAWQVYGQSRVAPTFRERGSKFAPPSQPMWSGDLRAGSILYMPRGWWHVATAVAEPCLHLTLGLGSGCRTGIDYLQWLAAKLGDAKIMRRDIPRFGNTEEIHSFLSALRQATSEGITAESLQHYLRENDFSAAGRPTIALPYSLIGDGLPMTDFTFASNSPRLLNYVEDNTGETVSFVIAMRTYTYPLKLGSVLRSVMDGHEHSYADTIRDFGHMGETAVRGLIADLNSQTLITLCTG